MSAAEFAASGFIEGVPPGVGGLAGTSQRRAGDFVTGEFIDPFDDAARLAGFEIVANLGGDSVGQFEAGGGE